LFFLFGGLVGLSGFELASVGGAKSRATAALLHPRYCVLVHPLTTSIDRHSDADSLSCSVVSVYLEPDILVHVWKARSEDRWIGLAEAGAEYIGQAF